MAFVRKKDKDVNKFKQYCLMMLPMRVMVVFSLVFGSRMNLWYNDRACMKQTRITFIQAAKHMNNKKRIVFEELKTFGNEMNGRQKR